MPVEFEPVEEGFLPLTAEVIAAQDSDATNNRINRTLAVQPPLNVLYLGERMHNGADRLEHLLGKGFKVEDVSSRTLDDTLAAHRI